MFAFVWATETVQFIRAILTLRCAVTHLLSVDTHPPMSALELIYEDTLSVTLVWVTYSYELITWALPSLQRYSQSCSSDPSLQSISPSHTWLYSTHSCPSLHGLEPIRHFNDVETVSGAMVGHSISSDPSMQWGLPSHTRSLSTHLLPSLHRKSPIRKKKIVTSHTL